MRAVVANQPGPPGLVAEQDEVLAHDADELRGMLVVELLGDGDGVPVAAQQLARGRAGANASQQFVFFSG